MARRRRKYIEQREEHLLMRIREELAGEVGKPGSDALVIEDGELWLFCPFGQGSLLDRVYVSAYESHFGRLPESAKVAKLHIVKRECQDCINWIFEYLTQCQFDGDLQGLDLHIEHFSQSS